MSTSTPSTLEFLNSNVPNLPSGEYTITVEQTVTASGATLTPAPTAERTFTVAGPQLTLDPTDIDSRYPPPNSLGDHSRDLPSLVLNRSSLPWERNAVAAGVTSPALPWLALLLFDGDHPPAAQLIQASTLANASSASPWWPWLPISPSSTDLVSVIDVPWATLNPLLPSPTELTQLTHVRQIKDSTGAIVGSPLAVVVGNRLPASGTRSVVHLVSLEARYDGSEFNSQGAAPTDSVRLISLLSWEFSCGPTGTSLGTLLNNLNRNPSALRLPASPVSTAESFLAAGYVPLPQRLRTGGKSVGWYHGPLAPGLNLGDVTVPVHAADELLRFDTNNGMFDVSYAAAWELGRLLTLQNKNVSTQLYNWKRNHQQQIIGENQRLSHLPFPTTTTPLADQVPADVSEWFGNLSLLKGIPFSHLVPDEQMLPVESVRFFQVDPVWTESLLDGAFSIGRVTTTDLHQDASHITSPATNPNPVLSGVLVRSFAIAGWPGLVATGYLAPAAGSTTPVPANLLRMDRLNENVLLCLFEGNVQQIDLHQPAGPLHFNVTSLSLATDPATFTKDLRSFTRTAGSASVPTVNPISATISSDRVIDIDALTTTISASLGLTNLAPGELAYQMIAMAEGISFSLAQSAALTSTQKLINGHLIQQSASLAGLSFANADFTGACLTAANLTGTNLQGAKLAGVSSGSITGTPQVSAPYQLVNGYMIGPGANLQNAYLVGQNLGGMNLAGANLEGANFTNASLAGTDFRGANLSNAFLNNATLYYADLRGANLDGANLYTNQLGCAKASGIIGTPTNLYPNYWFQKGCIFGFEIDLSDAELTGCQFGAITFPYLNLQNANLANTSWQFTNLSSVNLVGVKSGGIINCLATLPQGISLVNGYIIGPGVNLTGADLSGASLVGTNLTGAVLASANLTGITSSSLTGPAAVLPSPWKLIAGYLLGPGAGLIAANLSNQVLTGANLEGANLSSANLSGATLTGVNLNGANLTGASLSGATLTGVSASGIVGVPTFVPLPWMIVNDILLGPGANATGADLSEQNLNGVDLTGANLTGVKSGGITGTPTLPTGYHLIGGYLMGPGVDLTGVNLSGMDLTGVDLTGAVLTGVISGGITGTPTVSAPWIFKAARDFAPPSNFSINMTTVAPLMQCVPWLCTATDGGITTPTPYSVIGGANFPSSAFGYLIGPGANLSGVNLSCLDLTGANLSGANLYRANLSLTNLMNANMENVNLSEAILFGNNFIGTDLTGATLTGCHSMTTGLNGIVVSWAASPVTNPSAPAGPPAALPEKWSFQSNVGLIGPGVDLSNFSSGSLSGQDLDLSGATLTGASLNFNTTQGLISGGCIGSPTYINCGGAPIGFINGYILSAGVNLSGAQLANASLGAVNLSGADVSNADLSGANLCGANLTSCNLTGANFTGANLGSVILNGATAINGRFSGAQFAASSFNDADFSGADLSGAQFQGADLTGADLSNCNLRGATFTVPFAGNPILGGTNLTGSDLHGVQLIFTFGSQISPSSYASIGIPVLPAPWTFVVGQGAYGYWYYYLAGPGANLSHQSLTNLDFSGIDLTGANFTGATLSGTNFANATLDRVTSGGVVASTAATLPTGWAILGGYLLGPTADLTGATLQNIDLNGVDLSNACLTGTTSSGITGTPMLPAGWRLCNGYLVGPYANLKGVNLTNADLSWGVDLTGTNLSTATLTGVISGGILGHPPLPAPWILANGYLIDPAADLAAGKLTWQGSSASTLSGLGQISAMAVSTDGASLLALSSEFSTLSIFDAATLEAHPISPVSVSENPQSIAISPNGNLVYIASADYDVITVLQKDTLDPITGSPFPAPGISPSALMLSPDGSRLYVVCKGDAYSSFPIFVLDAQTLVSALATPQSNSGIAGYEPVALSPDGSTLFVPRLNTQTNAPAILPLSATTLLPPTPPNPFYTGILANDMAISPDGTTIYLFCPMNTPQLSLFDNLQPIPLPVFFSTLSAAQINGIQCIAVSPDGSQLAIAIGTNPQQPPALNQLFVLDTATYQPLPGCPFSLNNTPSALVFTPDGTRILVAVESLIQSFDIAMVPIPTTT